MANNTESPNTRVAPSDIAKWFLAKSLEDGELISPLRMQKLVYYAYSWTLAIHKIRLFEERLQAWPNGPVVPSLYRELKKYKANPISEDYLGGDSLEQIDARMGLSKDMRRTLDEVYNRYMSKTAFELVVLTHSELPWHNARSGLDAHASSEHQIDDADILRQYRPAANSQ